MVRAIVFGWLGLVCCWTLGSRPARGQGDAAAVTVNAAKTISFPSDVAPILQQYCIDCHGPNLQMAELRLDERRYALGDGEARGLIKPGHSADSLLVQRLVDKQLGLIMPPSFPFLPGETAGLPADKIETLKAWIDQGAVWPESITLAANEKQDGELSRLKPLLVAIRAGNHQTVAAILKTKTLINARDKHGATPLMQAATLADAKMVALLLEHGADVNLATPEGVTALMRAAGDVEKVRLLLPKGAQVNARTAVGRTPLLIAATFAGNVETVRLLLKHGAKVTDIDQFGETCLTSASKRGDAEMARELIAAGADVSAGGRPPLVWAAEEGTLETIACLLEHGAANNKIHASFALSSAATRGPHAAVRLLLEHGADANAASMIAGYTPLMWAAYSENTCADTVQLLLAKGADASAKGATGETSLSLAEKHGKTQIVALLKQQAAGGQPSATPLPASGTGEAPRIEAAAEKALSLLQDCGPQFFAKSGCIACHQQSVTSLAVAEARRQGLHFDAQTAREQVQLTALTMKGYQERFLQRVDHPAGSAPSVGYILLGLAAEGYEADEITDASIVELAGRQQTDGSWTAYSHRPPLEYSRVGATALALRALQLYGPPGMKARLDKQIERARDWLAKAEPASTTEHAFRLLGLAWAAADKGQIDSQVAALLQLQRDDGGWSQTVSLASDAFATGLTLYALHSGGSVPASHDAYQRATDYLLRTQLADGSWHVPSRSFPFQPYFESGFPHGHDQWISASATGFATVALLHSVPTR